MSAMSAMKQTNSPTTNDFVPVRLSTLMVGTVPGYDLFLKTQVDGVFVYVLYNRGDHALQQHHIEELQNNNVQNVYVHKSDRKKYLRHIESSLQFIIKNRTDVKEKSQLVYNVAMNIMTDIFEDPRAGTNVERSKDWVSNIVEFIMTSEGASSNMLNMVSYDYYTYTHCVNVSILGLLFSKHIGLDDDRMNVLGTGLLLHDIGKTQVAKEIVNKNGQLSNSEFAEMKKHVEAGIFLLKQLGGIDKASFYAVSQHHERDEGGGYPYGLRGNDIHEYGKIAKIVDVYDALTTKRAYSDARKPFNALTIMKNEMKGNFSWPYLKNFILFLGSGGG